MKKFAAHLVRKHGLFDSFYIANLKTLENKISEWKKYLPDVQPFYAVKCNPDKKIISTMVKHNFGFDCASKSEIEKILNYNVSTDNIIFAHPVKGVSDLKFAVSKNIKYTTFDSMSELEKISKYSPYIKCLIRLRVDNPSARVQLGLKYGVTKDEYKGLIDFAKEANLEIVGTSFHVGSASKEPVVFKSGIEYSKEVFEYIRSKGYNNCNILDIGGGFTKETFKDCAQQVNKSISENFKDDNIKIIAEPGRYFAEETFTFFTPVVGQRTRDGINEYWIADGLYGSFNCILYDGQNPNFEVFRNPLLENYNGSEDEKESIIFGATCDSADKIGNVQIPYVRNNDFIMCPNFGAYTLAGSCNFNGIPMANTKIFYTTKL